MYYLAKQGKPSTMLRSAIATATATTATATPRISTLQSHGK